MARQKGIRLRIVALRPLGVVRRWPRRRCTWRAPPFGALTDPRGYYFINNLPAGVYDVRAAYIGLYSSRDPGPARRVGRFPVVNFAQ